MAFQSFMLSPRKSPGPSNANVFFSLVTEKLDTLASSLSASLERIERESDSLVPLVTSFSTDDRGLHHQMLGLKHNFTDWSERLHSFRRLNLSASTLTESSQRAVCELIEHLNLASELLTEYTLLSTQSMLIAGDGMQQQQSNRNEHILSSIDKYRAQLEHQQRENQQLVASSKKSQRQHQMTLQRLSDSQTECRKVWKEIFMHAHLNLCVFFLISFELK